MISLSEFSRSPQSARSGRVLYEDLALVAHLSELERKAMAAKLAAREPSFRAKLPFYARLRLFYGSISRRLSGGTACSLTPQAPVSIK